jgi:hypothetical protein
MKTRYFISASLSVDVTDDRLFARRLHVLADRSVAVLHVIALRSGCGACNQTTNGTADKDTCEGPSPMSRNARPWPGGDRPVAIPLVPHGYRRW